MRGARVGPLILLTLLVCPAAWSQNPERTWLRHYDAGRISLEQGDREEARAHFERALATAASLPAPDWRYAASLAALGRLAIEAFDYEEANRQFALALAALEEARGPDHPEVADLLLEIADLRSRQDDYAGERELLERALGIRTRAAATPAALADIHRRLAWNDAYEERFEQAWERLRQAIRLFEDAGLPLSLEFADLLDDVARFHENWPDSPPEEADKAAFRALNIRERYYGSASPEFANALRDTAGQYYLRDSPRAGLLYGLALEIRSRRFGPESPEAAESYFDLARAAANQNDPEARRHYERALAILAHRPPSEQYSDVLRAYAGYCQARHQWSAAIAHYERLLEVDRVLGEPGPEQTNATLGTLAELHLETDNPRQAEIYYQRFAERHAGGDDYAVGSHARLAARLGDLYYRKARYLEAGPKLEEALALYRGLENTEGDRLALMPRLSEIYRLQGRRPDAEELDRETLALSLQLIAPGASLALTNAGFLGGLAAVLMLSGSLLFGAAWLAGRHLAALTAAPAAPLAPVLSAAVAEPGAPGSNGAAPGLAEADGYQPAAFIHEPEPELVSSSGSPLPVHRLDFWGDGATLFSISMVNMLLSVSTLGVYYFWGKAKVRRYIYGQTEFDGDRFAFHGTGGELFRGWLRAMPVLALLIFLPDFLSLAWQSPAALAAGPVLVLLGFLLIWPIAEVGAHRYRLNRTSWRGIGFSFRGSTRGYLALYLRGYLLTLLTGGLWMPFFAVRARRYRIGNSWFGDLPFRFEGHGHHLLGGYLTAIPLAFLTLGLSWFWWQGQRERYYWSRTFLGNARFLCTARGGQLLKLWTGNTLILLFTLGFGLPWVTARKAAFWTTHIRMTGPLALDDVRQDARGVTATAEGFADFLGVEVGV